ncbi:SH3 type 3 domain protein [Gloeothece citriformis PCC 7424]|uniref:SH3 type 3 domain protein n=1 Tax=Gloeothece citriformis (strain PCC 7424) TaxID=65393 RepID=B7K9Q3_GLOC7|nr:SH3 domain-containing protein [Gloeothece citriformis]ACK70021.1 SH3 type 3 domain protein [Gloeothece citriformis PCC 7424]
MNYNTQKFQLLGFTVVFSLASAIIPKTVDAAEVQSSPNSNSYRIAQITDNNCRRVDVNTNLNVRRQPGGIVIGVLRDNENVAIIGETDKGWVRINDPIDGYVYATYLNYCSQDQAQAINSPQTQPTQRQPMENRQPMPPQNMQTMQTRQPMPREEGENITTVPGSNCRRILAPNVAVRSVPKGNIVGTLQENENVYIANEGYNGWVPIERPMSGYVSSSNLGYCQGTNSGQMVR